MKPLYTKEEFKNAKSRDGLPCECYVCTNIFHPQKRQIVKFMNGNINYSPKYCSKRCMGLDKSKSMSITCTNCDTEFEKKLSQIKKSKTGNHFCSKSCSVTYNNKHKKHGTRRSKLEIWLEEQLTNLYPELDIDYNKTKAIGSELDIHIPSLNLAIEFNGIFHYEPIFGVDKLQKIQENDQSKSKACFDNRIDLCIIDTSGQKYFKPKSSQKYLDVIINIINERLLTS